MSFTLIRGLLMMPVTVSVVTSEIYLNPLFSDDMILQTSSHSGDRSFIYGTADAFSEIILNGNLSGCPYQTTADESGKWKFEISHASSGMDQFHFNVSSVTSATSTKTFHNVKYGDVFLCIGADNMNLEIQNTFNSAEIYDSARKYKNIQQ
jgi:hypothetical protein